MLANVVLLRAHADFTHEAPMVRDDGTVLLSATYCSLTLVVQSFTLLAQRMRNLHGGAVTNPRGGVSHC
ncbi:hypothetical protein XELAEV_18039774mg [Xenopus laevis]|uniref:Uncharacterized protein n=1 Tax=Xenopus laevis TaxID=8355 RepID=A0A974C8W8_XENLA|nr:hypothetical protein XELAEV_18039774mg [Xenopus laevis]